MNIPLMNPVRFRDNSKRPDYDNEFPLPDNQVVGKLTEEGVFPLPYVQDWIKNKSIVLQLRTSSAAPDLIAVRENQSNLISSWINNITHPYETFTTEGNKIKTAINTAGYAYTESDSFSITKGEEFTIVFFLDLNSGQLPEFRLHRYGADMSNAVASVNGANSITLIATETGIGELLIGSILTTNYSTSEITIYRSYRSVAGVDISPLGWTGDDVYKYTFTPDFTGLFYMFFEDTPYRSDYLYSHGESAVYKSDFISGIDGWGVEVDGSTDTEISNINEKLSVMIVTPGIATRPEVSITVNESFFERNWIMKIKGNCGKITGYETDDGVVSLDVEMDGTEKIIGGNGITTDNKILLTFDSTDAPNQILIDYVTIQTREDMTDKRRLLEVDYQNSENDYGMIFFDGVTDKYEGKILLTGRMLDPQPANDRSVFESDRGMLELLRSTPKRIQQLKISDTHRSMVDQINHIFACDTLRVNGETYQVLENLSVEPIEGCDLVNININIQKVDNDYFISNP